MSRIFRPTFRRKTGLRMSKYEATLEHAFKEADVEIMTTAPETQANLTRFPDAIVVASGSTIADIDISVPASGPQTYARLFTVRNETAASVDVTINGGTPAAVLAGTSATLYVADGTSTDAPIATFG
jgi:hypothetical protein